MPAPNAGLDFATIDVEHTGFSISEVSNLIAWFKATPVAPMVRVPQIERHFIARILDAGALGIMVPNVRQAKQIQTAVNAAKYAPPGERGSELGLAQSDFKRGNVLDVIEYSNYNTAIICQVESPQGIANLEAIAMSAAVEGVSRLKGRHDRVGTRGIAKRRPG
jgi:2-dehydro-3-deoxyglucarate aldolase/4-hydroxy-2-oxoheptanedioate aldolase